MIPVAFDYQKVSTVDEAIAALAAGDAKILVGGHSLLPAMKLRLNQPAKLVDISRISTLKGITEDNGEVVIGAGTTHGEIAGDAVINVRLPFFAQAASLIGDVQVRNHGTIGGSLAHADPAADWGALVLAADATIDVAGSNGRRSIPASAFFTGLFSTALEEGEIITDIRVPIPPDGTKTTYQKFMQPASRFAIVGCAVMRKPDGSKSIAFTGVSECPFRDSGAEAADSDAAAVGAAVEGITVMSDHFASEAYRRHLAKVYLKRALQEV